MLQIIETCKIEWISEGGKSTPLSEMHDDHILRAAAWCQNRLQMSKSILDRLSKSLHETAISHNGKLLSEWVDIFITVANARAEVKEVAAKAVRRKELEAELLLCEDTKSREARLLAELESLS